MGILDYDYTGSKIVITLKVAIIIAWVLTFFKNKLYF